MKRNYTVLEYKSKIRQLRKVRPDISISSDFIVGFPGETEADFQATLDLSADIGFDHSFSFLYSKRQARQQHNCLTICLIEVKKETIRHFTKSIGPARDANRRTHGEFHATNSSHWPFPKRFSGIVRTH